MSLGPPTGARMPQIPLAIARCEGACSARAPRILGMLHCRRGAGAGLRERRGLLRRANAQRTRATLRLGSVTLPWTGPTVLRVPSKHHHTVERVAISLGVEGRPCSSHQVMASTNSVDIA